jgi:membrane associated rhomboid family serine protease
MPPRSQISFSFGPPLTRAVRALVIYTSAAFLLTFIPAQIFGWSLPFEWLSLRPYYVTHRLFIWQLVTYLFLHAGWFHIIFNMFALWMFGADLERLWGSRQFLFYYFLTGIGAGLFDVLLQPSAISLTIGCSGAIYGLLLAYGMLFPDRPIFLYFIIPIKAKWFVALMGLIEFVSSLSTPGSGVSHLAHLGGMLFGFLYLRGHGLPYRLQLRFHEWQRARLRKRFEVFMRKQEKKDDAGRWIN